MNYDEMIAVIQARRDGKTIEARCKPSPERVTQDKEWTVELFPAWNFDLVDYRVKPEPMEFWGVIANRKFIEYGDRASAENAIQYFAFELSPRVVRVREVLE